MKKTTIIILLILTALLSACTRQIGWVGLNYGNIIDASYQFFDGKKVEKIQVNAGERLIIDYDVEIDEGLLHFELLNPQREQVWEASFLEDHQNQVGFPSETNGRYTLRIIGEQTRGSFELRWETVK